MTTPVSPVRIAAPEVAMFGTLRISFDERVLRPRAWTVAQAEWASELLGHVPPGAVLELCAGAGHIGLLATDGSLRQLVLVDVNPAACHWARVNADTARPGAVDVREADLAMALADDETFPLIIADPPWVATASLTAFPEDPRIAIDGGADGLVLARLCLEAIDGHLAPGGSGVLQLGDTAQVEAVGAHLVSTGSTLEVGEVREFDRGVLALIRRRSTC
jgi:release factor glutamine methyltransferase